MTPKQIQRVIRSLTYRQELAQKVPFLQAQLLELVREQGPLTIGGFRLEEDQGELVVKKLPTVPLNQLPLPLDLDPLDEAEIKQSEVPDLCLQEGVCLVCERSLEEPEPQCDCSCHNFVQKKECL
jgi:hypothetical protein